MRIGMFADMYKPHVSGVTNCIALNKRRFEELGHEVFVFTFGNRDYVDDERGIVRSPALSWGATGWQLGLRVSDETRDLMATLDIAHVHHPFVSGRVALKCCAPAGIPIVFTNHTRYDLYSDAYAPFLPKSFRMSFLRRYLREFASDVDLVIAPSPGVLEWLSEFGITDSAVELPNGVDTKPFAHPPNPRTSDDLGLPPGGVIFCYLGRLGPEKNAELLVDAFMRAAELDSRVQLLVIGDGPSRGDVSERLWAHRLQDRVRLNGLTPYDEVPNFLAAADAFATASTSEVHPLVVMEALAAGLPAIGIHSPGVGDIIDDGITGFLTNPDAEEFARRMLELTRDEALRTRMSEAAVRTATTRYDIRTIADTTLAHYESLIAERAAKPKSDA